MSYASHIASLPAGNAARDYNQTINSNQQGKRDLLSGISRITKLRGHASPKAFCGKALRFTIVSAIATSPPGLPFIEGSAWWARWF